jgi:hypothetical protein
MGPLAYRRTIKQPAASDVPPNPPSPQIKFGKGAWKTDQWLHQMNQYHSNWITYRSTAEALKREKHLFLATAGPYGAAENPHSC